MAKTVISETGYKGSELNHGRGDPIDGEIDIGRRVEPAQSEAQAASGGILAVT